MNRDILVESDIIVGVIDTGIWPESESFKDEGFGPPPKKGACEGGKNFTCNNVAIAYGNGISFLLAATGMLLPSCLLTSVRGVCIHHLAVVALVLASGPLGILRLYARGGVPAAGIATYKLCDHDKGCSADSILAAFDDAIDDGVNVITISIGSGFVTSFDEDPFTIGAFHAMKKGILTIQPAGNEGPQIATVSCVAPWILTASTIDRHIIDKVVLANGKTLVGNSINTFRLNGTSFPSIHGKDAAAKDCTRQDAGFCKCGCLDSDSVKGKIVVCDAGYGDTTAYDSGALGSILHNDNTDDLSQVPILPTTMLMMEEHNLVKSYINSTSDPRAKILKSDAIKDPSAPAVTSFSSRGPNLILPDIIKPDISVPGAEILATYSPNASITQLEEDKRRVKYNMLSGTSVSCPHAAGAAAYVKAFHPDWFPTAIKSSLMTTAWLMNDTSNKISTGAFAYGSGHINPLNAVTPGLVYEACEEDYIKLLCIMYDEGKVRLMSGDNSTCPKGSEKGYPKDLNHPSMGVKVAEKEPFTVKFHRRVKNVGFPNSTYKAKISSDSRFDNLTSKLFPKFWHSSL
ncbi:hypothetical protein ACFX13_030035 [Malus domestica]